MTAPRPRPAPAPPPPRLTGINWDGSAYCFNCITEIFGAGIFTRPPAPPLSPIFGGVYVCARCDFDAVAGWYDGPRAAPARPRLAPRPPPAPFVYTPALPPVSKAQIFTKAEFIQALPALAPAPAPDVMLTERAENAGWRDIRISNMKDFPPTPAPLMGDYEPGTCGTTNPKIKPVAPGKEPAGGWGRHNWTPGELEYLHQWKLKLEGGK